MKAVLLSSWNATLVMYHFLVNADHNPFHKKTLKKQPNKFWSARRAENAQKSTKLSKQQESDSGQTQCSKHSVTGLLLSSHSESFITAPYDILDRASSVFIKGDLHSGGLSEWECLQQTGHKFQYMIPRKALSGKMENYQAAMRFLHILGFLALNLE